MAKESGLFSQVRERLNEQTKDAEKKAEERLKKLKAKEEITSQSLNPEWDEQEKKMTAEIDELVNTLYNEKTEEGKKAEAAMKVQMLSLAMLMQTKLGKNKHLRNGARRMLLKTIDIMHKLEIPERRATLEESYKDAHKIIEDDMEDESQS
jgi:hypothetical protein